jgi:hypothetical protein
MRNQVAMTTPNITLADKNLFEVLGFGRESTGMPEGQAADYCNRARSTGGRECFYGERFYCASFGAGAPPHRESTCARKDSSKMAPACDFVAQT